MTTTDRTALFNPVARRRWRSAVLCLCAILLLSAGLAQEQGAPAFTPEAAKLFNLAVDAFRAGNLALAIERMREADKALPGQSEIRLYLGLFLYETNNGDAEAQQLLEASLDRFPTLPDLPLKLLNSYLASGNQVKVDALLGRLRPRLDQDPRFAFNAIYTLIRAGQAGQAKAELERQSGRLQGEVQFLSGLIAVGSGQAAEALGFFDRAGKNGFPPASSKQTALLGDALFGLREFRGAAKAYDAYLQNFPEETQYAFRAGLCYFGSGDFPTARDRFEQVVRKNPKAPEANFYLGSLLIELKQPEEAGKYLQAELANDPNSFKAMTKMAYVSYLAGDNTECRKWLDKSYRVNPDWFETQVVNGLLYNRLGQYDKAVASLEKAIAAEPGYPKAYYQLSIAYKRLGNEQKASEALNNYNVRQGVETARALEALGMSDEPKTGKTK